MPELPEVQTTVDGINAHVKGQSIVDVWTNYKNTSGFHTGKDNIKDPKFFTHFKKQVIGKKIVGAKRRAKNILINLNDGSIILIHLKMTGHLMYGVYNFDKTDSKDPWKGVFPVALKDPFNRHIRFILTLSNKKYLALSDMRRFAKVTFIQKDEVEKTLHLKDIGPEPLDKSFSNKIFVERLRLRLNTKIKQVLLEPKIIAGIGNIYSDEILWRASIHPERKVRDITDKEFKLMFKATQETLQKGIDFGGDSMSDYRNILGERGKFQEKHEAYRRKGLPCRKRGCSGIILRKIVATRSAHFCSEHQK